MADSQTIPITFGPGVVRSSTAAGVGTQWYDSQLMRWVLGRLRPVGGWEKLPFSFLSPIRTMHIWTDQNGTERVGVLCERHLYVIEGGVSIRDITPADGINPPSNTLTTGGYGDGFYGTIPDPAPPPAPLDNIYGTPRHDRPDRRRPGDIWRLDNWGEDLLAMASSDGRLLHWIPGPDLDPAGANAKVDLNLAVTVPNAPYGNRTFIVTTERHVMLFCPDGVTNKFCWCSQENIEDWNFSSVENTAGFYTIEPASRIVNAMAAQYAIIFWTVEGAYQINYKGLPYIYAYSYLGQHSAPISGMSPVAYSGTVIWPAADGFWRYDGNNIQQVVCAVLDWWQQEYDEKATRAHMSGWFNGANSEVWWCFPAKKAPPDLPGSGEGAIENDRLIIYNFQEKWWSIGKLKRTCGIPGTTLGYPLMADTYAIYRHEKGNSYPDLEELPWIRSSFVNIEGGVAMATVRQLLVDTDAELDAVSYQLFATKGRYRNAPERTKDAKLPSARRISTQGKIDYRISGRDFAVKMASQPHTADDGTTYIKPWSFGQGHVVVAARGKRGAP